MQCGGGVWVEMLALGNCIYFGIHFLIAVWCSSQTFETVYQEPYQICSWLIFCVSLLSRLINRLLNKQSICETCRAISVQCITIQEHFPVQGYASEYHDQFQRDLFSFLHFNCNVLICFCTMCLIKMYIYFYNWCL